MRLGIIGGGVVGHALFRTYVEWVDKVHVYDRDRSRSSASAREALQGDLVFLCLPEKEILPFLDEYAPNNMDHNLVVRSTVPLGSTRDLYTRGYVNTVHSPDFLTERVSVEDSMHPTRHLIGCPSLRRMQCHDVLRGLYRTRFPTVPIVTLTSSESELVKLATNAFFATKIAFFNELESLVRELDLDWEAVRSALLLDGRIDHHHTRVPGPDGQRGFGGRCLPKDLNHYRHAFEEAGLVCTLADAVVRRNKVDRPDGA